MNHFYKILLTQEEEGGYMATVPNLPGCITNGETIAEALEMADEAIALYLEELAARGEDIPPHN